VDFPVPDIPVSKTLFIVTGYRLLPLARRLLCLRGALRLLGLAIQRETSRMVDRVGQRMAIHTAPGGRRVAPSVPISSPAAHPRHHQEDEEKQEDSPSTDREPQTKRHWI
jgi:hypothetical protein